MKKINFYYAKNQTATAVNINGYIFIYAKIEGAKSGKRLVIELIGSNNSCEKEDMELIDLVIGKYKRKIERSSIKKKLNFRGIINFVNPIIHICEFTGSTKVSVEGTKKGLHFKNELLTKKPIVFESEYNAREFINSFLCQHLENANYKKSLEMIEYINKQAV